MPLPFSSLSLKREYVLLALLLLGYFAVRACYFDYPLIFDARFIYAEIVLKSQWPPLDILHYSHDGHNSHLWIWLTGLPNYIFPRNYYVYNMWVALLGTLSVAAFYGILRELFAQTLGIGERLLLTALFAFHPSVLANQVHVTLDTGLLIFWVLYLLALLKEKTVSAAIMGCFLLFSKEPAMAYLPMLFLFCAMLKPGEARLRWTKTHAMAVWIPFCLLALFLIYKSVVRHYPLFFHGFLQKHADLVRVYPDASLGNYALMAFVLNFNWLLMGASIALAARMRRMPHPHAAAFALLFAGTACVVLGVRHWANVRYLLPLFPVMILCLAYVLPALRRTSLRLSLLAGFLALMGWQNVRSVDPVSNAVFCTTMFGEHRLLAIHTFDLCRLNTTDARLERDQLVYNLEFMHIPMLLNAMMHDVRPDNHTAFFIDEEYGWETLGGLDQEYRLAYASLKVVPKLYLLSGSRQLADPRYKKMLPGSLYYIEFPTENNAYYRKYFSMLYLTVDEKLYDIDGYQLRLLHYAGKKPFLW